jgi:hypothetical protein
LPTIAKSGEREEEGGADKVELVRKNRINETKRFFKGILNFGNFTIFCKI